MFNVGDEVVISDSAKGQFAFTWPGSVGVITRICDDYCVVKFSTLTNPAAQRYVGKTFPIKERFLELNVVTIDHELIS